MRASTSTRTDSLLQGCRPSSSSPVLAVWSHYGPGRLFSSLWKTWWPCWRRLSFPRPRRAGTSWWPITLRGLFSNSGSTRGPWWSREIFASVLGRRRRSIRGWVETAYWAVVLLFFGPAWSYEGSACREVYFIVRGASRRLLSSSAPKVSCLGKLCCLSRHMFKTLSPWQ